MRKNIPLLLCGLLTTSAIFAGTSVNSLAAPKIDPYKTVQAEINFGREGVEQTPEVYNNKKITVLSNVEAGDYWLVKTVDFNEGLSKMSITVKSDSVALIEVRKDGVDGEVLGSFKIGNTNGEYKTYTANMKNVEGNFTIAFVGVLGNVSVDYWSAEKAVETPVVEPEPSQDPEKIVDPYGIVEAEDSSEFVAAAVLGKEVAVRGNGYVAVKNVDFGDEAAVVLNLNVKASKAALFEIRLDAVDGTKVGTIKVNPGDYQSRYATVNITGKHDVYFVATMSGATVTFDSWKALRAPVKPNPNQDPEPTPEPQPTPDPEPIPDPEPTPEPEPQPVEGGMTTDYTINNWGTGYQVSVKVTNESNKRTEGWTVKINKEDVDIDACWNVNVTEEGGYYVITPVEWNAVIDAGKSVEFGFQGSSHIKDKIELFAVGEVKDEPTPEPQPTPDPEPQPQPTPDPQPTPEPEPVVVNDGLVLGYDINGQGSFTISFNVSNNGDSAVNGWTLKLKKSQLTIDNSWCVKIASEGDYYVITPETWNYVINAGDAAYFGIQGSGEVGATLDYILE